MKKVLLLLALTFGSLSTSAIAFDAKVGVYGAITNDFDDVAVIVDKPVGGVIVSFDEGMLGADLYSIDDQAGVDIRANFSVESFTLSVGVGYQNSISGKVTDNDDMWDSSSITVKDSGVTNFIEVSHTSGVFARVTQSDYDASADFTRSHIDPVSNMRVLDNAKNVTVNEKLETLMIGYRHSF